MPPETTNGDKPRTSGVSGRTERVLLTLCALAAAQPAWIHYHFIEPVIERTRYPWPPHFLPSDFLLLRYFGELVAWFPVIFGILFVDSFFRRKRGPELSLVAIAGFLIFLLLYLCLALVCFRNLIVWSPEVIKKL
jgi:hypothetical protein